MDEEEIEVRRFISGKVL